MLKKILQNKIKIVLLGLFIISFALIRAFENELFYDPFLNYFKSNYFNLPLPKLDYIRLFFGLTFRYFLNSVLSLGIIYLIFKEIQTVSFIAILYVVLFIVLIALFFSFLLYFSESNKMTLFYVRRFLIQPLFVMLFIPALYFQKIVSKK